MPYAAKANEIQSAFNLVIAPYFQPGNIVAHDMYDNLELPWEADPEQTAFPKEKFQRFEWDRGGVLSDGKDFFGGSHEFPIGFYEKALGTVSGVTRWREAHPELVGTERDCVTEVVGQMRGLLGERGMRGGGATALLMFKRGE
jgi:trans-aconitate 3-methyltransferase